MKFVVLLVVRRSISHCNCRQHDTLSQKMNASGYREKAPQSKQDEDMKKIAALLEELEIIREAESELESNNWKGFDV